jgi:hypothetical protein
MLIQVILANKKYDYVKDFMLGNLIETGDVVGFRRDSGWVTIGTDPVRSSRANNEYQGIERRMMGRLSVDG